MTREEAIEVYNGLINEKIKAAFEFFAPELRESEDERVRRCIGMALTDVDEQRFKDFGTTLKDCLAWLEKQKENPKNADSIPADCVSDAKCGNRSLKHTDSFGTDIRDTPAYWRGWDDAMKQKEQKPAEWSEEDEKMRYFVTEAVQSRYSDRELAKYLGPKIIKEKKQLKQKLFDWLRDLRPSWKPSEE